MSEDYPRSGTLEIDALIRFSSYAGPRNSSPGGYVTLHYNLGDSAFNLQALNTDQQNTVRGILAEYEAVAGINFVEGRNPATGQYDLGFFIGPDGTGGSYWPNSVTSQQDGSTILGYVEVHQNHLGNFDFLIRHEMGHAVGLDHPSNYNGDEIEPHLDSDQIVNFSIMGYNDDTSQRLSEADIATLQYLYGQPLNLLGDSLDLSDSGDLFSSTVDNPIIYARGGNDTLNGSELANQLHGNQGADTLYGLAGNDYMRGGKDNDFLQGNADNDQVFGDRGEDTVRGGKGVDTVRGGKDNDTVMGDRGDDIVRGDLGFDSLRGGKDNDTLYGGGDDDTLVGDKGNDLLFGEDGNDIFVFRLDNGVDQISDFNSATESILLINTGHSFFENIQPLLSEITEDGVTSTLLNLGNLDLSTDIPTGNGIMFIGVSQNELGFANFLFE